MNRCRRPVHHIKRAACLWAAGAVVTTLTAASIFPELQRGMIAPEQSTVMLDRTGAFLGEVPGEDGALGYWPLPVTLPDRVVRATLETEDRHFYSHPGLRPQSVARAIRQNVTSGRIVSGASTIAMQVARMQDPGPRTYLKKAREAAEAMLLVHDAGHERVLRQYLKLAPYGMRVRGVVRAARFYFDKPVEDLSWLQAAFLAGLPKAPGRMNPYNARGLARGMKRAHNILRALYLRDVINHDELTFALESDLGLQPRKERPKEAMHAVLALTQSLREKAVRAPIVRSTIDLQLQRRVQAHLRRNLAEVRHRGASNSASVVVDTRDGAVLAYVGSVDYFDEEDHGAIDFLQVKRSPGSTLKPFIYAMAFEDGRLTAASELDDVPMDFVTEGGRSYMPRNIGRRFLGPMLARDALGNSRNIPALRVLAKVGVEKTLTRLEKAGVKHISYAPDAYGLGLALGNLHLTPMELARLYGIFANDGAALDLHLLQPPEADLANKLANKLDGRDQDATPPPPNQIFPASVAHMIRHILDDPEARLPSFPRGSVLDFDYATAVKTGTSQGYRDAWAAAFTDRLLVVTWTGNHDWRRMGRLGGLRGAATVTRTLLDEIMPQRLPHVPLTEEFPPPAGWSSVAICSLSGHLASENCPHTKVESFQPGTEPHHACKVHRPVLVDRRNQLLADETCPPEVRLERVMLSLPDRYRRWAKAAHLDLAPTQLSPLCASGAVAAPAEHLAMREPQTGVRLLFDPDTPPEFSTIRLAADVSPRDRDVVFLVDGEPVAKVGYPHEVRWPVSIGRHTIEVAFAEQPGRSAPVRIVVVD